MNLTEQQNDFIERYGSSPGIEHLTKLASGLLNNGLISVESLNEIPELKNVLTEAVTEYASLGLNQETLDKIKSGHSVELQEDEKILVIDAIFNGLDMKDRTLKSAENGGRDHLSIRVRKYLDLLVPILYKDAKVKITGNLVQVVLSNKDSYFLFSSGLGVINSSGISLPFPKEASPLGPINFNTLLLNIVNIDRNNRSYLMRQQDEESHEIWHAFDLIRNKLLGKLGKLHEEFKSHNYLQKIKDKFQKLKVMLPEEFINYVFDIGKQKFIESNDLKDGYNNTFIEISAHIAGFLKALSLNKISRKEVREIITERIVSEYLLKGMFYFDELRRVCDLDDKKYIVNPNKVIFRDLLEISQFQSTSPSSIPTPTLRFWNYFTEVIPGTNNYRIYKEGKEDELLKYYQEVVDLVFNDLDSPIVAVSRELDAALDAYYLRSDMVGYYQALVEMSLLPYTRWPAFVRLKNSGIKFPKSKRSLQ